MYIGFLLVTAFLSMWLSNTATAAMMAPLASAVMDHLTTMATPAHHNRGAGGEDEGHKQLGEGEEEQQDMVRQSVNQALQDYIVEERLVREQGCIVLGLVIESCQVACLLFNLQFPV